MPTCFAYKILLSHAFWLDFTNDKRKPLERQQNEAKLHIGVHLDVALIKMIEIDIWIA
jgi:hypothetical protein